MADSPPDLVQRAAARLAKSGSAQTESLDNPPQPKIPAANQAPTETPKTEFAAQRVVRETPSQVEPPVDQSRQKIAASGQTETVTPKEPLTRQRALREPPPQPAPETGVAFQARVRTSQRRVNLSPTSLAARGIVLPSSGVTRTLEEFRALKRNVLANMSGDRGGAGTGSERIVLVTSANSGDGKTFVAINLALALAFEKGIEVLLMDADSYRQSCLGYMGISAERGWIDHIAGDAPVLRDLVLQTNEPNLLVLPSGGKRHEVPELMSSQGMKTLLDELIDANPNRIIIIDALPCLVSAEPVILSGLAGQTIFIVAAQETSQPDVETSLRLLSASPNVSLILNKAEPGLGEQFKGYGYGYVYQNQPGRTV
jgi:Mrp family chromosome partitioning ATPase